MTNVEFYNPQHQGGRALDDDVILRAVEANYDVSDSDRGRSGISDMITFLFLMFGSLENFPLP